MMENIITFFMSDTYLITKDRVLKMMDRLDDISMMSRLDRGDNI